MDLTRPGTLLKTGGGGSNCPSGHPPPCLGCLIIVSPTIHPLGLVVLVVLVVIVVLVVLVVFVVLVVLVVLGVLVVLVVLVYIYRWGSF